MTGPVVIKHCFCDNETNNANYINTSTHFLYFMDMRWCHSEVLNVIKGHKLLDETVTTQCNQALDYLYNLPESKKLQETSR